MKSLNSKDIKIRKHKEAIAKALQKVFNKCIGNPAGSPVANDPTFIGPFPPLPSPIYIDFIISDGSDDTEKEDDYAGD